MFVVLAVGTAAYYAGRFGRPSRIAPFADAELTTPAAPAPAVAETVATPAEVPPTVTPPIPAVIEKGRQSSRVMVERSSQIVVPVAPPAPTAIPAATPIGHQLPPTPGRRVVVEVQPTPTPTVPELERQG